MDLKEYDFIAHLLVIDDDDRIRSLLDKYLTSEHYLTTIAQNAVEAEKLLKSIKFDLIITDKMMPEKDGIDFVKDIRSLNNLTPVIMLTAMGDIDNKILGLSIGADDYIAKPFEAKELLLRIKNILKRTQFEKSDIVKFGNFSFNTISSTLKNGDKIVKLTGMQKDIMNIFMKNLNQVISRNEFSLKLGVQDERSIDVAITRLRKQIEADSKNNEFIITIRNVGYKFVI